MVPERYIVWHRPNYGVRVGGGKGYSHRSVWGPRKIWRGQEIVIYEKFEDTIVTQLLAGPDLTISPCLWFDVFIPHIHRKMIMPASLMRERRKIKDGLVSWEDPSNYSSLVWYYHIYRTKCGDTAFLSFFDWNSLPLKRSVLITEYSSAPLNVRWCLCVVHRNTICQYLLLQSMFMGREGGGKFAPIIKLHDCKISHF